MKKIIYIIAILSMFCTMSNAQDENLTSRVKIVLNGGSIFYGDLVEYIPEKMLKVKLFNGQVVQYGMKSVKKVIMVNPDKEFAYLERPYQFPDKRFVHNTRLGISSGTSNNGAGASYAIGYQIKNNFLLGMGVGVDNYYGERGYNMYPIFAEAKYYFLQSNSSPFVSVRGGVAFGFRDLNIGQKSVAPGGFLNPVFGYRLGGNNLMFEFFTGIKMQKMDYEFVSLNGRTLRDVLARRLDLGIGMTF